MKMSGGLDLIIVGVAAEGNLDHIAPDEELKQWFCYDDGELGEFLCNFHEPVAEELVDAPRIVYLKDKSILGSMEGAALGYVLFVGGCHYSVPARLNDEAFSLIPLLKESLGVELRKKGLPVPEDEIGVYAVHISDA
jgi:hypothetical protein